MDTLAHSHQVEEPGRKQRWRTKAERRAVVEETLARVPCRQPATIEEVLEIDARSRAVAQEVVREKAHVFQEERGQLSVRA